MSRSRARELVGMAAVGVGVCCGLPALLGAGVLGTAAGLALGGSLVVAIGVMLGALGLLRSRRGRSCGSDRANERLNP